MEINLEQIKKRIERRIINRIGKIDWQAFFGLSDFYIAGNSINIGKPNDFDLFPVNKNDFTCVKNLIPKKNSETYVKSMTKNALTVKHRNRIIQFCNYHSNSLEELVESFDFAHIKIGAKISFLEDVIFSVSDIYISPDYVESQVIGRTWFTGSEYPLSSLMRLFKYYKKGDGVFQQQFIFESIKILNSIISRGYKDYEDFKDQLDAMDLGLAPDDFEELSLSKDKTELFKLFDLLLKGSK